jgi:hypothetical protein
VITHRTVLTDLGKGKIIAVKIIIHTLFHWQHIIKHTMCEHYAGCVIYVLFKPKQFLFTIYHIYFYFSMDLQSLEFMYNI